MAKITKNVLILSKENSWRKVVSSFLEDGNFQTISSKSGKDGMIILETMNADIILCDKFLSDMSGFKFLESLHAGNNGLIPIFIFLTEDSTKTEIRTGMDLGADDYLAEPFTKSELLNIISRQVEKRKKLVASQTFQLPLPNFTSELLSDSELSNTSNGKKHVFLDDNKNPGFYALEDIIYISSQRDYTQIYTSQGKKIILHKTLSFWENFLPPLKFLRIHRQTIINLDYIEKVEKNNSYRYTISLRGVEESFVISQRYTKKIKSNWGVN